MSSVCREKDGIDSCAYWVGCVQHVGVGVRRDMVDHP